MSGINASFNKKNARLTPSKSSEAIPSVQPLQVTTTALAGTATVPSTNHKHQTNLDIPPKDQEASTCSAPPSLSSASRTRKPGSFHRHQFIKSPLFQQADKAACVSPGLSPMTLAVIPPTVVDTSIPSLPPPVQDGPSEAIAALQDAANGSVKVKSISNLLGDGTKPSSATIDFHSSDSLMFSTQTATCNTIVPSSTASVATASASSLAISSNAASQLELSMISDSRMFESSFFSAVMFVQWSNVVGPKVKKVWSGDTLDDQLLITIARQVLNGEMGRALADSIEPKWLVLHRQGLVCTSFLFQDPVASSMAALVMVVPVRYLRNFSQYFSILSHRVPNELVAVLVRLKKACRRLNVPLSSAMDYFGHAHLYPFIRSVMDLESVCLPSDSIKVRTLYEQSLVLASTLFRHRYHIPCFPKIPNPQ
ncbi:hypothetical protein DM01DRAFT_84109 [Hesseltinella vesiculosa]|uniref:Uncharacterized protein n=1 Tax=Hesseltinella vesiculosa TaxID=101127 RepID=A0A1X2G2U9_9FUNG|nr:hypothetical protein DM01DRAFT_84109 [Hesseltinella vesiculosa]